MTDWPAGSRRSPSVLIPRPAGLHRATYERLLREHGRILKALAELPRRDLYDWVNLRLKTQLTNRLARVRRALGIPVRGPRRRAWYRIGQAASLAGVSTKTLLRWVDAGRVRCVRRGGGPRYFSRRELLRLIDTLRT